MKNIPPIDGVRLESPASVMARFGRKKSWLWNQVKNNKNFPRPIRISAREPMFIAHEVDAYISDLAVKR